MEDEEINDDIINEIIADLVSDLVDLSDEEIESKLKEYQLDPEDEADVRDTLAQLRAAESEADTLPQNSDFAKEVEDDAQQMANEDETDVTITEEDSDGDGDTDSVSVEKETTDDDSVGEEEDDDPHDQELADNKTNDFAKLIASHKY